jgi:hypothetical protein
MGNKQLILLLQAIRTMPHILQIHLSEDRRSRSDTHRDHLRSASRAARRIHLILLLTAAFALQTAAQLNITVTGAPHFDTSGLYVTEAGDDYQGTISESMPATYLSITETGKSNRDFVVYASLAEPHGAILLEVKRLSDGTTPSGGQATGRISGGKEYIPLSATPVPFFECKGDRINILLGFALRNLSVTQPAGNLNFQVIFTAYPK